MRLGVVGLPVDTTMVKSIASLGQILRSSQTAIYTARFIPSLKNNM